MREHAKSLATIVAAIALIGCDSGTDSFEVVVEPIAQIANVGVVRPDQPTASTVAILKPFVPPARVELVSTSGAILPTAGAFPVDAGNGIDFAFPVVVTPPATAGVQRVEGLIALRFTRLDGELVRDVALTISALAEQPSIAIATELANFQTIATGETLNRSISVRNPNQATPVQVTAVEGVPDGFTLNTRLPLNVAPGRNGALAFHGAPTEIGNVNATITISTSIGTTLEGTIRANVIPEEVVIDLGDVPVDPVSLETDDLTFEIGPDAASFSIEIVANPGEFIFPVSFIRPDGAILIDEAAIFFGPYIWDRNLPAELFDFGGFFDFNPVERTLIQVPNDDDPATQIVAGEYSFRLFLSTFAPDTVGIRIIVKQRGSSGQEQATLDLNVFLADGILPTAATASTDTTLQQALSTMDAILANAGLRVGRIDYFDITDPTLDAIPNDADFRRLLRESSNAPDTRLNLFFVRSIGGGDLPNGILGIAGALPGLAMNGTDYSGVMTAFDGFSAFELGSTSAHEAGHFLGLFHTVESSGEHDFIFDTLECDPFFPTTECPAPGGNYLMHWSDIGPEGILITDGQARVLRGHPLVRAGIPPFGSRLSGTVPAPAQLAGIGPPTRWCAHCSHARR